MHTKAISQLYSFSRDLAFFTLVAFLVEEGERKTEDKQLIESKKADVSEHLLSLNWLL